MNAQIWVALIGGAVIFLGGSAMAALGIVTMAKSKADFLLIAAGLFELFFGGAMMWIGFIGFTAGFAAAFLQWPMMTGFPPANWHHMMPWNGG